MPSRRSELQIMTLIWQQTSSCNTEGSSSVRGKRWQKEKAGTKADERKAKQKANNSESKRINKGKETTKKICTDYMKAVSLLPWSSVRLPQQELSLIAGWWMKCEAQSGCHLRHRFLMAVVVWNRRHCSRKVSQASNLTRCLEKKLNKTQKSNKSRAFLRVHLKNNILQSIGGNKK